MGSSSGSPERRPVLGHAVDVRDAVLRRRRDASTWREHAHEVERIAGAHGDALFAGLGKLPHGAHRVHRFQQGKLLARERLGETAAANLSAGLHPPVDLQELAPGWAARLAPEQIAEDDPVPAQVLPRELVQPFRLALLRLVRAPDRPPARGAPRLAPQTTPRAREPA